MSCLPILGAKKVDGLASASAAPIPASPLPAFSGASSLMPASAAPLGLGAPAPAVSETPHPEAPVNLLDALRVAMKPALKHLDGGMLDEIFKTHVDLVSKLTREQIETELTAMLEDGANPKRFEQALLFAESTGRSHRLVFSSSCEAFCLYQILRQKTEESKSATKGKDTTAQRFEQLQSIGEILFSGSPLSREFKKLWQEVVEGHQKFAHQHSEPMPKKPLKVAIFETCLKLSEIWQLAKGGDGIGLSHQLGFITMLQHQFKHEKA